MNQDDITENEEEDFVDVFLAKSLMNNLYLFQVNFLLASF